MPLQNNRRSMCSCYTVTPVTSELSTSLFPETVHSTDPVVSARSVFSPNSSASCLLLLVRECAVSCADLFSSLSVVELCVDLV